MISKLPHPYAEPDQWRCEACAAEGEADPLDRIVLCPVCGSARVEPGEAEDDEDDWGDW